MMGSFLLSAWGGFLLRLAAQPPQVLRFEPRPARGFTLEALRGYCLLRLKVDDEVNVYLRGRTVEVEVVKGEEAADQGSECSQPLPSGDTLVNFEFKGLAGRGTVQLIEQPTQDNGYRAWVRIKDPRKGTDSYSLRLSWERKPAP